MHFTKFAWIGGSRLEETTALHVVRRYVYSVASNQFLMIHFRVLAMTIALLMNHPLQIQPQRPSPWRFDGRIFPCIIFSSWSYNPLHLIFVCEPCSNPILLIIVVSPS
jgi:hypothetical protein